MRLAFTGQLGWHGQVFLPVSYFIKEKTRLNEEVKPCHPDQEKMTAAGGCPPTEKSPPGAADLHSEKTRAIRIATASPIRE